MILRLLQSNSSSGSSVPVQNPVRTRRGGIKPDLPSKHKRTRGSCFYRAPSSPGERHSRRTKKQFGSLTASATVTVKSLRFSTSVQSIGCWVKKRTSVKLSIGRSPLPGVFAGPLCRPKHFSGLRVSMLLPGIN